MQFKKDPSFPPVTFSLIFPLIVICYSKKAVLDNEKFDFLKELVKEIPNASVTPSTGTTTESQEKQPKKKIKCEEDL